MTSPDPDLKSLFCEALERPGGPERDAYLEDACRGNPALKAGVEGLLAAHDQAGRFLAQGPEGPVADGSKTLAATATDAPSIATNRAETIANETLESARTSNSESLAFAEIGSVAHEPPQPSTQDGKAVLAGSCQVSSLPCGTRCGTCSAKGAWARFTSPTGRTGQTPGRTEVD